jgi:hypothetical protein
VSAAAEACPDKKRLLVSLMASVSAALESMNVVLEMCEGSMAPRVQVRFSQPSGMPPAATGWHLSRLLTSPGIHRKMRALHDIRGIARC